MRHAISISVICALWITACAHGPDPHAMDEPHGDGTHEGAHAEGAQDTAHAEGAHDAAHARGPADHDHGEIDFPVSCTEEAAAWIEHGVAMLHHMMYEQARERFETAAEVDAECAMAHWGVAMTYFQPLWAPPTEASLEAGRAALTRALDLGAPTERERGYIEAAAAFYADETADFRERLAAWEPAQRTLHEADPTDVDAAAFWALAHLANASPEDQEFRNQRRAGRFLEAYFEEHPRHPALFHYIIHAYDNPVLAAEGEDVARAYDALAPDVPHALHMPSHIFIRLGQWKEAADWNERSAEAALRQPVNGVTSLHYPHALDYLMYAYLQLDDQPRVERTRERIEAIDEVQENLASAYGIAAGLARYYLEQERWEAAAALEPRQPAALAWDDYPSTVALFHYARGLGAARSGDVEQARSEFRAIETLAEQTTDDYWTRQTELLAMTVEAWAAFEAGEREAGLERMREAAELDDSLDKHPITPGAVRPARELYGEMLLLADRPQEAREAFERVLERAPNRRNTLRLRDQAAGAVAETAARTDILP